MDTTAATMHPAEEYLRNEQNPPVLYVRIYGCDMHPFECFLGGFGV